MFHVVAFMLLFYFLSAFCEQTRSLVLGLLSLLTNELQKYWITEIHL